MPHARETIRKQFKTACTGLTTTGSRAYASRTHPFKTLPALAIYTTEDILLDKVGNKDLRQLTVRIECRAKTTTSVDDVIDDISAEVQTAVNTDTTLLSLIKYIELVGEDIALNSDGEKPIGVLMMDFQVQYRINATDPTTIIN